MIDGVSIRLSEATESSVRVTLVANSNASLGGDWELYGPRCEYARTLASTFQSRTIADNGVEFLATEPCYWSPAMPFLYELRRADTQGDVQRQTLGLRRLITHRQNLRLAGERIVLRGAGCKRLDESTARDAHDAECALVLASWDADSLDVMSRLGVFVLLDATAHANLSRLIETVSWHPAVAGILADRQSLNITALHAAKAAGVLLAQAYDGSNWSDAESLSPDASLIAATLAQGERPPAWMASCGRPVVAIRRTPAYADLRQARAACDRLQAELAPEFDLAGYFSRRDD